MLDRFALVGALGAVMLAALPAAGNAAILSVEANGVVATQLTGGGAIASGSATIGSPVAINFTFDSAALSEVYRDSSTAVFEFAPLSFSATLGTYAFVNDPALLPVLVLSNAFAFFGGPSSEVVLNQAFYFPGLNGPGAPFTISGGGTTLALISTFRRGTASPLPLLASDLRDLPDAAASQFQFTANDGRNGARGLLSGSVTGRLAPVAVIPESSTWLMMVAGFMLGGNFLRRRRKTALQVAHPWQDGAKQSGC